MKIVIAIDSFKGCMTSKEAGLAAKNGVLKKYNDANVKVYPIADGGEGTKDVLIEALNAKEKDVIVHGPFGDKIKASYGINENGVAIMEMASAAGITLSNKKDPLNASTYGVGQMIIDALDNGAKEIVLGIGGSATNDAGAGMLEALGYKFLDKDNNQVKGKAKNLDLIKEIDDKDVDKRLKLCKFTVACDVTNPLCGKNGATYIYGPQKGVTDDIKDSLDKKLLNFAQITSKYILKDNKDFPGAGAAGGLGFALLSFLNAKLIHGIELVLDKIGIEKDIKNADLVITGEGKFDLQSLNGKVVVGVANLAHKYNKNTIIVAGAIGEDKGLMDAIKEFGITGAYAISPKDLDIKIAMRKDVSISNMTSTIENIL